MVSFVEGGAASLSYGFDTGCSEDLGSMCNHNQSHV